MVGRDFGEWLWRRAHGIDLTRVVAHHDAKTISRDETFARDIDAAPDRVLLPEVRRMRAQLHELEAGR